MARKIDYSEADCFTRALMVRVYSKAKMSMLEQLDEIVETEREVVAAMVELSDAQRR